MNRGSQPPELLVIPSMPNRDWRQSSSRRVPTYRPDSTRNGEVESGSERIGDGQQRSGLRFATRAEITSTDSNGATTVKTERIEGEVLPNGSSGIKTEETVVKREPLTLEEQALQAILAGNDVRQPTADELAQNNLIISSAADSLVGPVSETDALRRDMAELPEESTIDDYSAVPVAAFGAAMLRGMGWDPKSTSGTTVHEPKQRPQLLGLGATPMDATIRPTHGNKKGDKKDKKKDYKERTGRGFVATNLLVKKEREGSVTNGSGSANGNGSANGHGNGIDSVESERRRRRDEEDDGRENSKRRGGEYETEEERARRKAREREREYETDEERARRKAREKERDRRDGDRDRDRDRDREREKSRYEDHDRNRDRDGRRERERDRDRGDDKDRRRERV